MNIKCYNTNNQELKNLTQWDINQKVILKYLDTTAPLVVVHACNSQSKEALVCKSTLSGQTITFEVPNILLQQDLPLVFHIYISESDGSAKTVYTVRMPVNPRPKPAEYVFSNNATYVSIEEYEKAYKAAQEATIAANTAAANANTAATNANNIKHEVYDYVDISIQKFDDLLVAGKNLYNKATKEDKKICKMQNAGTISDKTDSDTGSISDWIPVEAGEKYILSYDASMPQFGYRIHIADENNVLVVNQSTINRGVIIEIPMGATKIRFSNYTYIMEVTQFEKGDTATSYEPYTKKVKVDYIPIDDEMSDESENPVQNKVAKEYVDKAVEHFEDFVYEAIKSELDGFTPPSDSTGSGSTTQEFQQLILSSTQGEVMIGDDENVIPPGSDLLPVSSVAVIGYVQKQLENLEIPESNADIDIFEPGKNLLDESKLEVGALDSKGQPTTNENFKRTDYIYLEAGSYVYSHTGNNYSTSNLKYYFYDEVDGEKVFDANSQPTVTDNRRFTIDSPKYVRIRHLASSFNDYKHQLELGTAPTTYEPYKEFVKLDYIPVDKLGIPVAEDDFNIESENSLKNKTITERFNSFLGAGKNLYNNAKRINDVACSNASVLGAESVTQTATGHATSEWIEVSEGEIYIFSNSYSSNVVYRVHIVDENNILVKDYFTQGRNSAFEIPAGGKKIRFSNSQAVMDTTQFEKGDVSTEYEEYKDVVKPNNLPSVALRNWFEGKTILFDGDSITYGTGLKNLTTTCCPAIVCKELNAKLINRAVGGSAVGISTTKPYTDKTYKPSLLARYPFMISDYPEAIELTGVTIDGDKYYNSDNEEIIVPDADLVYIAIGSNDWAYSYTSLGTMEDNADNFNEDGTSKATPHTFYGALHMLCRGLISRYKGKPIIFATPIKRRMDMGHIIPASITKNGKTLKQYGEIIKEVCDYYSIPVIDMYSECSLTPHIDEQLDAFFAKDAQGEQDLVHPNEDGHKIMARRVVAGLRSIVGF